MQDGWMHSACQVFLCIAEMNIKKKAGGKRMGRSVCFSSAMKMFGELLEPVQACLNTDSVFMCTGHDMCDAGEACASKSTSVKMQSVINKEGGEQEREYVTSASSRGKRNHESEGGDGEWIWSGSSLD